MRKLTLLTSSLFILSTIYYLLSTNSPTFAQVGTPRCGCCESGCCEADGSCYWNGFTCVHDPVTCPPQAPPPGGSQPRRVELFPPFPGCEHVCEGQPTDNIPCRIADDSEREACNRTYYNTDPEFSILDASTITNFENKLSLLFNYQPWYDDPRTAIGEVLRLNGVTNFDIGIENERSLVSAQKLAIGEERLKESTHFYWAALRPFNYEGPLNRILDECTQAKMIIEDHLQHVEASVTNPGYDDLYRANPTRLPEPYNDTLNFYQNFIPAGLKNLGNPDYCREVNQLDPAIKNTLFSLEYATPPIPLPAYFFAVKRLQPILEVDVIYRLFRIIMAGLFGAEFPLDGPPIQVLFQRYYSYGARTTRNYTVRAYEPLAPPETSQTVKADILTPPPIDISSPQTYGPALGFSPSIPVPIDDPSWANRLTINGIAFRDYPQRDQDYYRQLFRLTNIKKPSWSGCWTSPLYEESQASRPVEGSAPLQAGIDFFGTVRKTAEGPLSPLDLLQLEALVWRYCGYNLTPFGESINKGSLAGTAPFIPQEFFSEPFLAPPGLEMDPVPTNPRSTAVTESGQLPDYCDDPDDPSICALIPAGTTSQPELCAGCPSRCSLCRAEATLELSVQSGTGQNQSFFRVAREGGNVIKLSKHFGPADAFSPCERTDQWGGPFSGLGGRVPLCYSDYLESDIAGAQAEGCYTPPVSSECLTLTPTTPQPPGTQPGGSCPELVYSYDNFRNPSASVHLVDFNNDGISNYLDLIAYVRALGNVADNYSISESTYNTVVNTARSNGYNPNFALAIWVEESGAGGATSIEFGCPGVAHNFAAQLNCFAGLYNDFTGYLGHPPNFEEFMGIFSDGFCFFDASYCTTGVPGRFCLNPNFPRNFQFVVNSLFGGSL